MHGRLYFPPTDDSHPSHGTPLPSVVVVVVEVNKKNHLDGLSDHARAFPATDCQCH